MTTDFKTQSSTPPRLARAGRIGLLLVASSLALSACASTKSAKTAVADTSAPVAANSEAAPTTAPTSPAPDTSVSSAPLPPATPSPAYTYDQANQASQNLSPYADLAEAGDRIYFLTDRFDLTDEARTILTRQAAWIKGNPGKRVIVAGNCDERGTREYNLALGARRASAARDFLISLGVSADRIETVSYGKERPIDDRPNPEGWAVNRNAQTVLLD